MSVLLIDPPRTVINKGNVWKVIRRNLPSLGLTYMAALLERHGHKVAIIDMNVELLTIDDLVHRIQAASCQIIGITATTVQINSALFVARNIKEHFPEIKIVMGGAHPHVMFKEVLTNDYVDYVVRGEGEFTMLELAENKNIESIKGLSYKKDGNLVHNLPRPLIEDLDRLPFPARHLIHMDRYNPTPGNYKRLPAASMVTSRGCPGKCTFCNTDMFGEKVRFRSAENIADEIRSLINNYKIKEISFYDDTFIISKKNIERLCSIIINDKIDITWSCMSRVDFANPSLFNLMRRAGCHSICFGIESADRGILSNINKKISLDRAKEVVEWAKKARMDVRVSFMLGSPGETEETLKKTIKYAISLDPDIFVYNLTTPLPGTAMFDWAKDKRYLRTLNWDDYDLAKIVMNLPSISPEKLMKYYKIAYRRSYLRLRYFIKRLTKIKSYESLLMHLRLLKEMLTNNIFGK